MPGGAEPLECDRAERDRYRRGQRKAQGCRPREPTQAGGGERCAGARDAGNEGDRLPQTHGQVVPRIGSVPLVWPAIREQQRGAGGDLRHPNRAHAAQPDLDGPLQREPRQRPAAGASARERWDLPPRLPARSATAARMGAEPACRATSKDLRVAPGRFA